MALRNGLIKKMISVQKKGISGGRVAPLKAWWQDSEQEACVTKVGGDRSQPIEVILEVWVFTQGEQALGGQQELWLNLV